jgi:hypothetical protein
MRNSTVLQMYQQQAYLRSGVELRQSSERPAVSAFRWDYYRNRRTKISLDVLEARASNQTWVQTAASSSSPHNVVSNCCNKHVNADVDLFADADTVL